MHAPCLRFTWPLLKPTRPWIPYPPPAQSLLRQTGPFVSLHASCFHPYSILEAPLPVYVPLFHRAFPPSLPPPPPSTAPSASPISFPGQRILSIPRGEKLSRGFQWSTEDKERGENNRHREESEGNFIFGSLTFQSGCNAQYRHWGRDNCNWKREYVHRSSVLLRNRLSVLTFLDHFYVADYSNRILFEMLSGIYI